MRGPQAGMVARCAGGLSLGLVNMLESQLGERVASQAGKCARGLALGSPVDRQDFRPACHLPEGQAGESMCSQVQGLWIDQGNGVQDAGQGLLREYLAGEE